MSQFKKGNGPACPECGCILSRRIGCGNGWSEPNDDYLRYKRCVECGTTFCTVEVVVPPEETTFYRLDYHGRELRRDRWRRQEAKSDVRLPTQRSDLLYVSVRVVPRPTKTCQRGHKLVEGNLYVYPNGVRQCLECRRMRSREYNRERMKVKRAAEKEAAA